MRKHGIAPLSLFVALAVAALIVAATRAHESQAQAPSPAVAAARPAVEVAEKSLPGAAAEEDSEIVGQIEPLLVGSPSPNPVKPGRTARR